MFPESDPFLSLLRDKPKLHSRSGSGTQVCWGISRGTAEYLHQTVTSNTSSLETGAGLSTLIFALRKSSHTAVTPNKSEIEAIFEYAKSHSITLDSVNFVNESSENYLPISSTGPLDLVLIDGRHAFPWPIIDYFYTAPRLKEGGVMLVDDIRIPSVKVLVDYLLNDYNWKLTETFTGRALAFHKVGSRINVEWTFQKYNSDYLRWIQNPTVFRRATRKSKSIIRKLIRGDTKEA